MEGLALIATAAISAQRCPRKLIRAFAGTTLIDIFLEKFHYLSQAGLFSECALIVPRWDGELLERIGDKTRVLLQEAVYMGSSPVHDAFRPLVELESRHVVWVNPCLPFVLCGTVVAAVREFIQKKAKALTTARRVQNSFWDPEDSSAVNNTDPRCISTKKMPGLFESTHAVHIFDREQMLRSGIYWTLSGRDDPVLFEMTDWRECVDVDTEADFAYAERLYAEAHHSS